MCFGNCGGFDSSGRSIQANHSTGGLTAHLLAWTPCWGGLEFSLWLEKIHLGRRQILGIDDKCEPTSFDSSKDNRSDDTHMLGKVEKKLVLDAPAICEHPS